MTESNWLRTALSEAVDEESHEAVLEIVAEFSCAELTRLGEKVAELRGKLSGAQKIAAEFHREFLGLKRLVNRKLGCVGELHKMKDFPGPMTQQEAQQAYDDAADAPPLSEAEVDAAVDYVLGKDKTLPTADAELTVDPLRPAPE